MPPWPSAAISRGAPISEEAIGPSRWAAGADVAIRLRNLPSAARKAIRSPVAKYSPPRPSATNSVATVEGSDWIPLHVKRAQGADRAIRYHLAQYAARGGALRVAQVKATVCVSRQVGRGKKSGCQRVWAIQITLRIHPPRDQGDLSIGVQLDIYFLAHTTHRGSHRGHSGGGDRRWQCVLRTGTGGSTQAADALQLPTDRIATSLTARSDG